MRLWMTLWLMASATPAEAARSPLQAYIAGDYSIAVRNYDAASRYFGAALAAAPDDVLLRRRAFELALTSGNFDRALRLANDIVKTDESISSVNQLLIVDAIRRKDWATASKRANQMPEAGIDAVVVPLLKCWAAVGKGDLATANAALDSLERGTSMTSFRQHQAAWVALIGGDKAQARKNFAELTKAPATAGSNNLIAAASLMSGDGDRDGAIKLLRYDDNRRLPATLRAALAALESGKPLAAPMTTAAQGLATAFSILANELARDEIKGIAVNLGQMAAWLAPETLEHRVMLADILAAAERYTEGRQTLEALSADQQKQPDVVMAMARGLAQTVQYDAALVLLDRALQADPQQTDLLMVRGDILRSAERYQAAADTYTKVIAQQPTPLAESNWSLFFARATCFERLKMWDKAEADLKQALALRPDDPTLLNYLGYSWLDQKRNIGEATKMIERALELRPGDGAIIDSLGWAHFLAGNMEKAIELLEQAIAAVPGDPTVNEHLGDAYWATGRYIEARHRWAAALESEPDKDQASRILTKLQTGAIAVASSQSS